MIRRNKIDFDFVLYIFNIFDNTINYEVLRTTRKTH